MAGLKAPGYIDGESLVPWFDNQDMPRKRPAITSWGRGNYTVRTRDWRYIRYFDGTEELYHNKEDVQEWNNLADDPKFAARKKQLKKFLPKKEAPLIRTGSTLHPVSADMPDLKSAREKWNKVNKVIKPPLD